MLGLTVFVVAAIYLVLLVWATRAVYRWAKKRGWSSGKCWAAATGGFLAVYLPVFWDWIPTLAANKYYCATEAGFKVYKTIEQWKTENPGVAESLTWKDVSDSLTLPDGTRRYVLNERFVWDIKKDKPISMLSTTVIEELVVDSKTSQVMAKHVSVGSGFGSPMVGGEDWRVLKSWLQMGRCNPMSVQFGKFQSTVKKLGEKK